jgi:hypothetical protein
LKGSLSFLVETISNVLVMEIGWTDVGRGGYILVSCAHSNTSFQIALGLVVRKDMDVNAHYHIFHWNNAEFACVIKA